MARVRDILASLASKTALERLYEERRALNPSEENRTRVTMIAACGLFLAVMAFILQLAWSRQDMDHYIESRELIHRLQEQKWEASSTAIGDCPYQICTPSTVGFWKQGLELSAAEAIWRAGRAAGHDRFMLRATIDPKTAQFPAEIDTLAVTLPQLRYRQAEVWLNGRVVGRFFDGEHIAISIDPAEAKKAAQLSLVLTEPINFNADRDKLISALEPSRNLLQQSLAVMPRGEWSRYKQSLAMDQAGRGNTIGMVARITMAVFVLIVFILVDGSPETLGLGLFLGFEALAISFSFGWVPIENYTAMQHYCYQMGDIFRLFFFLQLARIISPATGKWLFWASVLSIPYGILRHYSAIHDWSWVSHIPRSRDAMIGLIGTFVLVRSAWHLRDKNLPWRIAALLVASVGAFEQSVDPVGFYVPFIYKLPAFTTVVDVLQPASAWLLAFSVFINIGTMEKRVKELSVVELKAKEIEQEMELGRTVQRAFLHMPELPKTLGFECHHEAMLYVSGDTYYINYNEDLEKLTFLINDVTGHGIQAALKASAASAIARSMWEDEGDTGDGGIHKLKRYGQQVSHYLSSLSDEPDILAMGGAEFVPKTGFIQFYRMNFPFPLVIEPRGSVEEYGGDHLGEFWEPRFLPLRNGDIETFQIRPGTFVVLTSDGFIDNSRLAKEFLVHIRRKLAGRAVDLDTQTVAQLFRECELFDRESLPDDRTLVVFQWDIRADQLADDNESKDTKLPPAG